MACEGAGCFLFVPAFRGSVHHSLYPFSAKASIALTQLARKPHGASIAPRYRRAACPTMRLRRPLNHLRAKRPPVQNAGPDSWVAISETWLPAPLTGKPKMQPWEKFQAMCKPIETASSPVRTKPRPRSNPIRLKLSELTSVAFGLLPCRKPKNIDMSRYEIKIAVLERTCGKCSPSARFLITESAKRTTLLPRPRGHRRPSRPPTIAT